MEEKFNNEQEKKDNLDNFKNTKTTRRREKKKRKKLAIRLRWLFSFIIIIIGVTACTGSFVNEVDKEINEEGKLEKIRIQN